MDRGHIYYALEQHERAHPPARQVGGGEECDPLRTESGGKPVEGTVVGGEIGSQSSQRGLRYFARAVPCDSILGRYCRLSIQPCQGPLGVASSFQPHRWICTPYPHEPCERWRRRGVGGLGLVHSTVAPRQPPKSRVVQCCLTESDDVLR